MSMRFALGPIHLRRTARPFGNGLRSRKPPGTDIGLPKVNVGRVVVLNPRKSSRLEHPAEATAEEYDEKTLNLLDRIARKLCG